MNKKLIDILSNWTRPYISGTDLLCILDKSAHSRHAIIKRAVKQEYLLPLRRDLFLVKNTKQSLDSFEVATIIYGPSYVSFESALSYHGWIPEAVRTTTCASVKRSKIFQTPIGMFSYEHIPIKVFSLGVEQHLQKTGTTLFIATPVKALADIIYARKRSWSSLDDLFEDLRIEPDSFNNVDKKLFMELINNYPNTRVQKVLSNLLKSLQL